MECAALFVRLTASKSWHHHANVSMAAVEEKFHGYVEAFTREDFLVVNLLAVSKIGKSFKVRIEWVGKNKLIKVIKVD